MNNKQLLKRGSFWALILPLLTLVVLNAGCTDEREMPAQPEQPGYTETITLFNRTGATGQDMSATFRLRDNAVSARLFVTGFLRADADLNQYEQYGSEVTTLRATNDLLDAQIIRLELQDNLSVADSLLLDSLRTQKDANLDTVDVRTAAIDSLDTYLDDRFKMAVKMPEDTVWYYPNAVFIDSAAAPYLGSGSAVWGQGFYLAPIDSASGWRGKTLTLDLTRFWVADGGWDVGGPYFHPTKPPRGSSYTNQYPVDGWLGRMTFGSHIIQFRFAAPGTTAQLTASLYVVYNTGS
jgi:hypothetical protein